MVRHPMPKRTRSVPAALPPPLAPIPKKADRRNRPSGEGLEKLVERVRKGQPERRSFRERRATPRLKAAVALETRAGSTSRRYVTHDLSTFGLSIASGPTPRKGAQLTVKLYLPDKPDDPVELDAVVLGAFDERGGLRLKFVSPPLPVARRIHRLVK